MRVNEFLYFRIMRPIKSFFINLWIWIANFDQRKKVKAVMDTAAIEIKKHGATKFIKKFKYKDEKTDWKPWPSTLFLTYFYDDCDGAAVLAKWALEQMSVYSDIYHLQGDGCGHAICVSKNKLVFASNGVFHTIPISEQSFEKFILEHFNFKYERIFK